MYICLVKHSLWWSVPTFLSYQRTGRLPISATTWHSRAFLIPIWYWDYSNITKLDVAMINLHGISGQMIWLTVLIAPTVAALIHIVDPRKHSYQHILHGDLTDPGQFWSVESLGITSEDELTNSNNFLDAYSKLLIKRLIQCLAPVEG